MRRRRNQIEIIEDSFLELPLSDEASVLAVLSALHRQVKRNGTALADIPPATKGENTRMFLDDGTPVKSLGDLKQ